MHILVNFFATVIIFSIIPLYRVKPLIGSDVFGESHQPESAIFVIVVAYILYIIYIYKFPELTRPTS